MKLLWLFLISVAMAYSLFGGGRAVDHSAPRQNAKVAISELNLGDQESSVPVIQPCPVSSPPKLPFFSMVPSVEVSQENPSSIVIMPKNEIRYSELPEQDWPTPEEIDYAIERPGKLLEAPTQIFKSDGTNELRLVMENGITTQIYGTDGEKMGEVWESGLDQEKSRAYFDRGRVSGFTWQHPDGVLTMVTLDEEGKIRSHVETSPDGSIIGKDQPEASIQ